MADSPNFVVFVCFEAAALVWQPIFKSFNLKNMLWMAIAYPFCLPSNEDSLAF